MRRIQCRFENRTAFLDHYTDAGQTDLDRAAITFLAPSGLRAGERVRMVLRFADTGESHTLHMCVRARKPTLEGDDSTVKWWYRAVPTEGDAPWLEMLVEKFNTARRFGPVDGHFGAA